MEPKFIFVTGGVVSSVGKGVTAASIARLLKERGFKVSVQKLDPYLNVDPGTMSPYQHGEVFVLDDGAETDLDLGHYERFSDISLTRDCNVTTGQIYSDVIAKERRGDYLGRTIQVVPNVTDEIKRRIMQAVKATGAEILIVEVGGTVGDIEALPFLEALRQMRSNVGRDNCFYVHVTFLPKIGATGELKTKPTQHSVRELRSIGISPDMIMARSDEFVPNDLREKIAQLCDVDIRAVISMETLPSVYGVPLSLEKACVGEYILSKFGLAARLQPDWSEWKRLMAISVEPKPAVKVALVGKYVELHDAYLSVREALTHAGLALGVEVSVDWINSAELEKGKGLSALEAADGVLVPGGFGSRGIEGKILAARYARENLIPYFGLCLGMQLLVVDFGRYVLGTDDVNSTEFASNTTNPVIDLMPDQRSVTEMGGTMRLGRYDCHLTPGSMAARAYGTEIVAERHRHRFEFSNAYRDLFQSKGMVFSGLSPDGRLVEIVELADHPFMLGTQFHPEFLSRLTSPHPLFVAFINACIRQSGLALSRIAEPRLSDLVAIS